MILDRGRDGWAECYAELDDAIQAMTSYPVILNAQSYDDKALPPGIIYNLENVPLQVDPRRYRGLGRELWDFSASNMLNYPGDVEAIHVPIGYHPTMTRFRMLPPEKRDIDVLYYGSISERRKAVYDALKAKGLRVETVTEFGSARDAMIARAKCVSIIGFLAPYVFPVIRAAHLVANEVPLVAETITEVPWWMGRTYDYDAIVEETLRVVREGDLNTKRRFIDFSSQPMILPPTPILELDRPKCHAHYRENCDFCRGTITKRRAPSQSLLDDETKHTLVVTELAMVEAIRRLRMYRSVLTKDELRNLEDGISAQASWIRDHGGDPDEIRRKVR